MIAMTTLLQDAFALAQKLSNEEHDALAHGLMTELREEAAWRTSLKQNPDKLLETAHAALKEHREGLTQDLHVD